MWMNDREVFKQIMIRVQELSPESRLRLIEEVARSIKPTIRTSTDYKYLTYGELKGNKMSTDEDFVLAEWRVTEQEADGP